MFVCLQLDITVSTLPRKSNKVFFKTRMCLKNCDEFSVQLHVNLATSEIPRPTHVRSVTMDSTNQSSGRTSAYHVWTTTPQRTRPLPMLASACVCFFSCNGFSGTPTRQCGCDLQNHFFLTKVCLKRTQIQKPMLEMFYSFFFFR